MIKHSKTLLLAGLLIPGAAFSDISKGDVLGVSADAITAAVEAQGYSGAKVEVEDGEIEVEAFLNGQEYEIEVSSETGEVLAVYRDDDDHDDNDDDDDDDDDGADDYDDGDDDADDHDDDDSESDDD